MEEALAAKAESYSRYGSPVHKQVYIYGMLNPARESSKAILAWRGASAAG
jgi:hypothetical protein